MFSSSNKYILTEVEKGHNFLEHLYLDRTNRSSSESMKTVTLELQLYATSS